MPTIMIVRLTKTEVNNYNTQDNNNDNAKTTRMHLLLRLVYWHLDPHLTDT